MVSVSRQPSGRVADEDERTRDTNNARCIASARTKRFPRLFYARPATRSSDNMKSTSMACVRLYWKAMPGL